MVPIYLLGSWCSASKISEVIIAVMLPVFTKSFLTALFDSLVNFNVALP